MKKLRNEQLEFEREDKRFEQEDKIPKTSYYDPDTGELLLVDFLNDLLEDKDEEIVDATLDEMTNDTTSLIITDISERNLRECRYFLSRHDVETGDASQAIDLSIIRVLRGLRGVLKITQGEEGEQFHTPDEDETQLIVFFLQTLIQGYILDVSYENYRMVLKNGLTFDQHMREDGYPMNEQRHITKEEMGKVLVIVRNLFDDYYDCISSYED